MYTAVSNLLREMQARVEHLADRIAEKQDAIAAMEEILKQHHTAMQVIVDDMNRQEEYIYHDRCLLNELDHYKLQLEDMVATEQTKYDDVPNVPVKVAKPKKVAKSDADKKFQRYWNSEVERLALRKKLGKDD